MPGVSIGSNSVAQAHADSCLGSGTASHWSTHGLKPYMRYSLSGGYQNNGENWSCQWYEGSTSVTDINEEIANAMTRLMNSPGHRRTILDRWYRKVNVGLAWHQHHFVTIQHFEGDFVEYLRMPSIVDGQLRFSGRVKNGVGFSSRHDLMVDIWFDPPPTRLTPGQLIRVNGYDIGVVVAGLRPPLPTGSFWPQEQGYSEVQRLLSPEQVPPESVVPKRLRALVRIMDQAYENNQLVSKSVVSYPFVTADYWRLEKNTFLVAADLREVLNAHGSGVYSIMLWAPIAETGETVNISQYSVFVKSPPREPSGGV